ncbi:MAG: Thiol-disulfide oxidoreductase ResA [Phycisphaerae bacterium]|nr:Thiol-disulfide oxidoreductase ResA [Phycisphaerae bacterium]
MKGILSRSVTRLSFLTTALILILFSSIQLIAQDAPPATPPTTAPAGEEITGEEETEGLITSTQPGENIKGVDSLFSMDSEQMTHNFGEFWVGGLLEHTFEFTNTGTESLELVKVRPSCGCTLAGEFTKSVPPGGKGTIPITVDSKRVHGQFTKSISVQTNSRTQPNIVLRITGTVKQYLDVQPAAAQFGQLKANDEKTQTVKIINQSEVAATLTLPDPAVGKCFTASLKETVPGKEFELTLQAHPPYSDGPQNATLQLQTNIPQQPTVAIRLFATVLPRLSLQPLSLIIPAARAEESTQEFKLTNNGNNPVHLLEATTTDPKLTLTIVEDQPGQLYTVRVKIPAGYVPDGAGNTITFRTDDPEKKQFDIPVRRNSRPPRAVELMAGKPAPAFEFTTYTGQPFNSQSPTTPVTVLVAYASWCPHCKRTLPELQKIKARYEAHGVRFIALNLDDPEDKNPKRRFTTETAQTVLKDMGVDLDVYFDPQRKVGQLLKIESFPTILMIDHQGQIDRVITGAITGPRVQEFTNQLDQMLNPQPAATSAPASASVTVTTPSGS